MIDIGFCIIANKTKNKFPRLPFVSIKNKILGTRYELGVSFLSPSKQKQINLKYRGKNEATNILSFPLSKNSGEITFNLIRVKKDAPSFNMNYSQFLKYLFIHGLLHLKGFKHSSTMDKEERRYLKIFS